MFILVEVTTSGQAEAEKIGKLVVEERLSACANIIPKIKSYYWWKNKLEEGSEAMLLLKTKKDNVDNLISRIIELHSYENPAIIVLPIENGSPSYLKWIDEETN